MEELIDRLKRGWTLEEHNLWGWFIRGSKEEYRDDERYHVSREMVMELERTGVINIEMVGGSTVGGMVMR